eukprot:6230409-Pyramimonas_sp.AAC.1
MGYYHYAMCVHVCPRAEAELRGTKHFSFDAHYCKAATTVQTLLQAPRTPYLHGLALPTQASDASTHAMMQQTLFRPTRCPHKGCCRTPTAHSVRYLAQATS